METHDGDQTAPKTAKPAVAAANGSAAALGLKDHELKEMMKPFILLMHRRKLPWITIRLDGTIGTISTVLPPNEKAEPLPPDSERGRH